MIFKQHTISGNLNDYVLNIVYHKNFRPDHCMDKYLPDGTINIVFELTNTPKFIFDNKSLKQIQECRDVWFSGVQKNYITISAESEEMMVLVFKPGAGFPLIHQPIEEFTNKVVPAEEIFGKSILNLHQQLQNDETPELKFKTIEKWLVQQLIEDDFYVKIIQSAIREIENSSGQISLSQLSQKIGFSQKQFIQLFKKYVGITPKQFHRIVRFNEILSMVECQESISWTKLAMDCGYFDQAHFIKDFYSFSGINPKKYFTDIEDFPNFLPVK